jgi:hypothetical protein
MRVAVSTVYLRSNEHGPFVLIIAATHVAVTVHAVFVFVSKLHSAVQNQFPDVNSATAEVISRGAVVRTYCALHRHGLGIGSTVYVLCTVW